MDMTPKNVKCFLHRWRRCWHSTSLGLLSITINVRRQIIINPMPSRQRITKKRVTYSMIKSANQMRPMPLMMRYYLMHSDNVCNKDEATVDSNEQEISCSILYTESNTLDDGCTNTIYSI
jgi:hypothetical protein